MRALRGFGSKERLSPLLRHTLLCFLYTRRAQVCTTQFVEYRLAAGHAGCFPSETSVHKSQKVINCFPRFPSGKAEAQHLGWGWKVER